jgi:hypothetical protein
MARIYNAVASAGPVDAWTRKPEKLNAATGILAAVGISAGLWFAIHQAISAIVG